MFKKSKYSTDKQNLDKKKENVKIETPDVSELVTNTALNTKIGEKLKIKGLMLLK